MRLTELQKDQVGIIESLNQFKDSDQIRLIEMGFIPGKSIKKLNSSILSGPISYEVEGVIMALSKKDAAKITLQN
jgi:Fe2+ transport system protein FeoA